MRLCKYSMAASATAPMPVWPTDPESAQTATNRTGNCGPLTQHPSTQQEPATIRWQHLHPTMKQDLHKSPHSVTNEVLEQKTLIDNRKWAERGAPG